MGTVAEQFEKATRGELLQALSMSVDQTMAYVERSNAQAEQIKAQAEQIEKLQFQLAKFQKMIFGSRSEKSRTLMNPDQMSLFELPAEGKPPVTGVLFGRSVWFRTDYFRLVQPD